MKKIRTNGNRLIPNQNEFLRYVTQGCDINEDVLLPYENVWLTQKECRNYRKGKVHHSELIKNVFEEGE